jgi:ATP-dependent DNA helicase RecQ
MKNKIDQTFKTHFEAVGKELRDEQEKVILSVLEGKNTLCLMPTGGGKSLCYWVSGKALEGTTIVIFPLTALMDEQAKKLQNHGCKVFTFHSGINSKQQYEEVIGLYNGEKPDFIFVSPERLATDGFLEFVLKSIRDKIKLVVIDEVHCISQWGFDFRPFYKEIPYFLENVFGVDKPIVLGLTATINPEDLKEICKDFNISKQNILRSKYLLRYNIRTSVVKVKDEDDKDERFWATIEAHKNEKILIYLDRVSGKRSTETLSQEAIRRGYRAEFFHGERSTEVKADVIERFKKGVINLVFATSAFGMGIDIPDIRGVIHYLPTESVEQYYQQIGRAGRDSKNSWAILFYSAKNLDVRRRHFIEKSFPTNEQVKKAFEILTDHKVGNKTINYFQEEDNVQAACHYIFRTGLVKVVCKGLQSLSPFEAKIPIAKFEEYFNASKTKGVITTAKKISISEKEICENVFEWLAQKKLRTIKAPDKCLIVQSSSVELDEGNIALILQDIAEKKQYKHRKFDEFIALLEGFENHTRFQQAIGAYLGIDKFELGKIHETLSGVLVRSKSEVIIANILYERNVKFQYEMEIKSPNGEMYCPDFVIDWSGNRYFWEHLGMLDIPEYQNNWLIKKQWYENYFPGQLITTEECAILSKTTEEIITQKFK